MRKEEDGINFSAFKNKEYKNSALMKWFIDAYWDSGKKEAGINTEHQSPTTTKEIRQHQSVSNDHQSNEKKHGSVELSKV